MDELLGGQTSSPNICYDFVKELENKYEELKMDFTQSDTKLKIENIKWRDDMQFLLELGCAFRYFMANDCFPYINFKTLPNISNARWNSRAIYAYLAFILIPNQRERLRPVCEFISGIWLDIWFSKHTFNDHSYELLKDQVKGYKKAFNSFKNFWSNEDSAIVDIQRSNICAERAVKIAQDILAHSAYTMNLKYILTNDL